MGLTRKFISLTSLGAIDFRSDKERMARNARLTKQAVARAGAQANRHAKEQSALLAEQNRLLAEQNAILRGEPAAAPVEAPEPHAPTSLAQLKQEQAERHRKDLARKKQREIMARDRQLRREMEEQPKRD